MPAHELTAFLNKLVQLSFRDGELIEALLLGVDEVRSRDLTYEVRKIVAFGTPRARGTSVGATCVAALDDLRSWRGL